MQCIHPFFLLLLLSTFHLIPPCSTASPSKVRHIPKSPSKSTHNRNKYLVKFTSESKISRIASYFVKKAVAKGHKASIKSISNKQLQSALGGSIQELANSFDSVITDVYHELQRFSDKVFHGLALRMSEETLKEFKRMFKEMIVYVEKNGRLYASDVMDKAPASWGLARVSAKAPVQYNEGQHTSSDPFHTSGNDGKGVDVYVLDTGVDVSNPDFEGRAVALKSFVPGEEDDKDHEGHGTHCAGTIGSKTYGIARKSKVFGVKVLGKDGSGDFAAIVGAIDFVVQRARPNKSVINMSLGGEVSQAVNDAVEAAVQAGVLVVAAAGNEAVDACNSSPASSAHALTVGAIDPVDDLADFSNFGKCVHILAPGKDIVSLGIDGQATSIQSGTSMAAPHVAGIAAVYMSNKDYKSVKDIVEDLKAKALKDLVKDTKNSANLIAYLGGTSNSKGNTNPEDQAPEEKGEAAQKSPVESGESNDLSNPNEAQDEQKLVEPGVPVFQSILDGIISAFTKREKGSNKQSTPQSDEERLLNTPLSGDQLVSKENALLASV